MSIPLAITALAHEADALQHRLQTWADINSGSGHRAGLQRQADALEPALRLLTPAVQRLAVGTGDVLLARLRPDAPRRVLCSGHYDTVYEADSPFQRCRRVDPDRLVGPGVSDMKGGLVIMLAALAAFAQTPQAHQLGIDILLTPDEETGSAGSRPLLEEAARRCQLGLVFEPARETGDLVRSRKGTGIFTLTCHGRAAHAGRDPGAGRNAIVALAEVILALARVPDELPGLMLNVGRVRGGGTVNIVPDRAEVEINARSTTVDDATAFQQRLAQLADKISARDGYRLEVAGQFNRLPSVSSPLTEDLFGRLQAAGRDLGLPSFSWVHVGGGSDGNLLQAVGLPCLDGLGAIGGNLHSAQEWISLPSLVQRAQLAALFLHRLASGEIHLERSA